MAATSERYQFGSLRMMEKAIKSAFGTHESPACAFEKGMILVFNPSGSRIFDTRARAIIAECGGKRVDE